MITPTLLLNNFRNVFWALLIVFGVWVYKDLQFQKGENLRQKENFNSKVRQDSTHYSEQILSTQQMNDYILYEKRELQKKLQASGVKSGRIESLTTNDYYYQDTVKRFTDVSKMISDIKNDIPSIEPFEDKDSLDCQKIKGNVVFDGKSLKVEINNREHRNTSESVGYWERKQWSFLGIKTRLFGKVQMTAKVFDDCGTSTTTRVEKKK